MDMLLGRDWLDLPNVNYYKSGDNFVIAPVSADKQLMDEISPNMLDLTIDNLCVFQVDSKQTTNWRANQISRGDDPGYREQCTQFQLQPLTLSQFKIGNNATETERNQLMQLVNEFRDVFATSLAELGCTNVLTMDIPEVPGSVPVHSKPFRTSPSDRRIIADILQDWRSNGIISDSNSPYASPVILVNKASGEKRLCIDYRKLNKQTTCRPYPMPDIDSQLSILSTGNLFTTLDLANGFLQIPLSEEAKDKTAFVTEGETARFNRMPFGLCGAPGTFQKLMNIIFKDLRNQGIVGLYLDDIILPAKDWPELLKNLRRVFVVLRNAKLTLKPSKCIFGSHELDYLGFKISPGHIQPGQKISSITSYPVPKNVLEVRQFLGLTGFFRRFVPNYATLASPLSCLLKKNATFRWSDEQAKSFENLLSLLSQKPILRLYSPDAPVTQIHTDASAQGLAGIMLQGDNELDLHLVYCVSKSTTEAEMKYHSSKLELYAIIWTLGRLRPFLIGIKFTVLTDCQALVFLNIHKTTKPQIARWFDSLQEFDFDIKYRPGSRMAHVDALSRTTHGSGAIADPIDVIFEKRYEVCLTLTQQERVRFMQQGDPNVRTIMELLTTQPLTTQEKERVQQFEIIDGLLYRKCGERRRFVVPKPMRKGIVIAAHDLSGHFGLERTINKLRTEYWFPSMRRYVRQHISMCLECLVHKRPAGRQPGLLHPIPPGKRPFAVIHVDHLGPFETSTKGNRYLLVAVDNLTKYVTLYPTKTTDTASVIRSLTKMFEARGYPDRIISDRGTAFTSQKFKEFCQVKGVKHTLNSSRHPQANGQVERVNRTLIPVLSMSATDQNHWDAKITEVEQNLNTSCNKATKKTPFELVHGYHPDFRGGVGRQVCLNRNDWTRPERLQVEAHTNIIQNQKQTKLRYDAKRHNGIKYDKGEIVVMLRQPTAGECAKLQAKYRTKPLQVVQVLPSDTYRVAELTPDGNTVYSTTAHVSQLKSWSVQNNWGSDTEEDEPSEDKEEEPRAVDVGPNSTQDIAIEPVENCRPRRERQKPQYLEDYVLQTTMAEDDHRS